MTTPAKTMKHKLYMHNHGDSVSVDSRGDIHFFNCWFNALQEPPERCEGWDKAEKYPYRVYYKREDGSFVYSDIQKLICPSDCEGDCRMGQYKEWVGNIWDVQQDWGTSVLEQRKQALKTRIEKPFCFKM